MRTVYPAIKPYKKDYLDVGGGHTLYIEESGSAQGIPVLFVHGGPGAGVSQRDRSFFNPDKYRIILFDQRGCGQSRPHASLVDNTTDHLLEDMEKIREHLSIEQWVLFGGSWGSTLSLLYAQANPERVLAMVLRGIFLCRQEDIDWFYKEGASRIFPEYWQKFSGQIPEKERNNLVGAYYKRLTGDDELVRMASAKQWSMWEARCATLKPNNGVLEYFSSPHTALSLASIETHYFLTKCYIDENQIIRDAVKLNGVRGVIVHGRYDMVCPVEQACVLHQHWPNSRLEIIRDGGHSSGDPSIADALVKATDEIANELADVF